MSNPEPPPRGVEYPSLESSPQPVDPYAPVDYPGGYTAPDYSAAGYPPPGSGLPPPVYPSPYPAYPAPYPIPAPGYPPAYPGYGGYGTDPYDPYRPPKPLGTNGKAIAALVTSLAGLVFCGLPSIAGVILGIIAMRETRRTCQDGYGLALAGVIVGALVIALIVLYIVVVIVLMASSAGYSNY